MLLDHPWHQQRRSRRASGCVVLWHATRQRGWVRLRVSYKTYTARTGFRARFAERTGNPKRGAGLSPELSHIGGILGDVEALVLPFDPPSNIDPSWRASGKF
jgi:hypothetical protein